MLLTLRYRAGPAITRTSGLGISYRADDPLPPSRGVGLSSCLPLSYVSNGRSGHDALTSSCDRPLRLAQQLPWWRPRRRSRLSPYRRISSVPRRRCRRCPGGSPEAAILYLGSILALANHPSSHARLTRAPHQSERYGWRGQAGSSSNQYPYLNAPRARRNCYPSHPSK